MRALILVLVAMVVVVLPVAGLASGCAAAKPTAAAALFEGQLLACTERPTKAETDECRARVEARWAKPDAGPPEAGACSDACALSTEKTEGGTL